jgi:hypothetical protein
MKATFPGAFMRFCPSRRYLLRHIADLQLRVFVEVAASIQDIPDRNGIINARDNSESRSVPLVVYTPCKSSASR